MWPALILGIVQLLLPFFEKLLVEWLKKRLQAEAEALGPVAFGSTRDAQVLLLKRVRASTWVWERAKRKMIDHAITKLVGK